MQRRISWLVVAVLAVVFLGWGSMPAKAFMYPTAFKNLGFAVEGNTVRYWVQDPISGEMKEDSWTLNVGDERIIMPPVMDTGIIAWVAKYSLFGMEGYAYSVHYRIYDPARGMWVGDSWPPPPPDPSGGWFGGVESQVSQLTVKQSVVAWKASRTLVDTGLQKEHFVCYGTYEPESGSWFLGKSRWQVAYDSPLTPGNILVEQGMVVWPMKPFHEFCNGDSVDFGIKLFDRDLKQWVSGDIGWGVSYKYFDFIKIVHEGILHAQYSNWLDSDSVYFYYDIDSKEWFVTHDQPEPQPRAAFAAVPATGFAPLWVCMWPMPFARHYNSLEWLYDFGDGEQSNAAGTVHCYTNPGTYTVNFRITDSFIAEPRNVEVKTYIPPTGTIDINGGAASTNSLRVKLGLNYNAQAKQMSFNEWDRWTAWEDVQPTKDWQLFADPNVNWQGVHKVQVQFKDEYGKFSEISEASIIVDTIPPQGSVIINPGQPRTTNNLTLNLRITGSDANPGLQMSQWLDWGRRWSNWAPFTSGSTLNTTYTPPPGDGLRTVYVRFKDVVGHIGYAQDSIIIDTTAPTGVISINDGAAYTKTPEVLLKLTPTDASQISSVRLRNDSDVWSAWSAFLNYYQTDGKPWTLSPGDGAKTVAVQFRDVLDQESAAASAAITLDSTAPTGTFTINGGAAATSSVYVTLNYNFSDATSGLAGLRFTNDPTVWPGFVSYSGGPATFPWTLTAGEGQKTVYGQFQDKAGNVKEVSASIYLGAQSHGKITINQGATFTRQEQVQLSLDDLPSNIVAVHVGNDNYNWIPCIPGQFPLNWTLEAETDGKKTVYVLFQDTANNYWPASDDILLDRYPPAASVIINNGAAYTRNPQVTLTLDWYDENGVSLVGLFNEGYNYVPIPLTSKTVTWELSPGQGKKTVWIDAMDSTGNGYGESADIILDYSAPLVSSFTINAGASYTKTTAVTLNLAATDSASGLDAMRFSNSTDFSAATWQTYAATAAWTLPTGAGSKTVYAQFRDKAGNISTGEVAASIILDNAMPTGSIAINSGAAYTKTAAVTLNLSASDPDSGLAKMQFSNDNATWSTLETYAATKAYTLTSGDGTKTVYARFTDQAGNVSAAVTDSIILDATPPTGTIAISAGAYTRILAVTLNLTSAGGATQMCFSADKSAWTAWEALAATKQYNLAAPDGVKWVYVKYRDAASNESAAAGASVILDTVPPKDGALKATPGNQQVILNWSGFSDATSGLSAYRLYYGTAGVPTAATGAKIYEGTALTFTHKGLTNGKPCYYRLCAADKAGNVSAGATAAATPRAGGALPFLELLLGD